MAAMFQDAVHMAITVDGRAGITGDLVAPLPQCDTGSGRLQKCHPTQVGEQPIERGDALLGERRRQLTLGVPVPIEDPRHL